MRALKIKEMRRKLERIGREAGRKLILNEDAEEGLGVDFDLDGEWDAEKHDRKMREMYEAEGEDLNEVRAVSSLSWIHHLMDLRGCRTWRNRHGKTTLTSPISSLLNNTTARRTVARKTSLAKMVSM